MLRSDWYGSQSGLNPLTNREISLEAIQYFEGKPHRPTTNPTMFSHFLPIVDAVEIKRILKLRNEEAGAFERYRDAISKNLRKHPKATVREQVQLFDDVIRPEIAKIDAAVRRSRKLLVRSIMQDVVVISGAIGIGAFSGLLPPAIGLAAAGLGSLHYSPQFVRKLTELCSEPKQAMDSRYYFLWKVRRKAKMH
jgi:hypothetical protein